MKKSVIAVGVCFAIGAGTLITNKVIVDKVAKEIQLRSQTLAESTQHRFTEFKLVKSEIDGSDLFQEYEIFLNEGNWSTSEPIYLEHHAKIALFGTQIDGEFTLPKDRGIAKDFVNLITPFKEDIKYTYSTKDETIDLKSHLEIDPIAPKNSKIKIGDIQFNLSGKQNQYISQLLIDDIDTTTPNFALRLKKASIETLSSEDNIKTTILADSFKYALGKAGFELNKVNMATNANIDDMTSIDFNWQADNLEIKSRGFNIPASTFTFSGQLNGLYTSSLKDFGFAVSKADKRLLEEELKVLFGNGFNLTNLEMKLNESSLSGVIAANKADYTQRLTQRQRFSLFRHSIQSDLKIVLTDELVKALSLSQSQLERYWTKTDNSTYTTTYRYDRGELSLNGHKD